MVGRDVFRRIQRAGIPADGTCGGRSPDCVSVGAIEAVLWVVSCVASCFAFLALFRGAVRTTRPWMDSLSRSAYIIYVVHYVYVLWLQRALMGLEVHAS